jgi:putative transposase
VAFKGSIPEGPAPATPEDLYIDLPRRRDSVPGLWSHQVDLLRLYMEQHQWTANLAIELPTGTGKTLTGLLLAEWVRRHAGKRVLYACPTKQLAKQVQATADRDGSHRPLDGVYAAIFIDAIVVKIRDGQVANRPIYAAIGVTLDGEKDILGLWAGTGGEGAKFWMSVLTDIKNRGVTDMFFLVCGGLQRVPEVLGNVWPLTTVQTCVIHLIRNTFKLASKKDWDALKRDVKPIFTAPNPTVTRTALEELTQKWGKRYVAISRLWESAWEEFIPFLDYDEEIRRVICSTNAIESLNARYRRAVRARGHFSTEQAALKCLYLVTRSPDPTGAGRARWTMRWKPALNAFAITFQDRWPAAETY